MRQLKYLQICQAQTQLLPRGQLSNVCGIYSQLSPLAQHSIVLVLRNWFYPFCLLYLAFNFYLRLLFYQLFDCYCRLFSYLFWPTLSQLLPNLLHNILLIHKCLTLAVCVILRNYSLECVSIPLFILMNFPKIKLTQFHTPCFNLLFFGAWTLWVIVIFMSITLLVWPLWVMRYSSCPSW